MLYKGTENQQSLGQGDNVGLGQSKSGSQSLGEAYGAHKRAMEYQKPIQENKRCSLRKKKKLTINKNINPSIAKYEKQHNQGMRGRERQGTRTMFVSETSASKLQFRWYPFFLSCVLYTPKAPPRKT